MDDPRDLSRFRGTELALAEHGLKAYHMAPRTISSVALGRQMFLQMQQTRPDIDAIFVPTTIWRWGCCSSARRRGKPSRRRSPSPVFTGWKLPRAAAKIASVITPRYEIGKTASEILIARLTGKDAPDSVNLAYQIYYGDTL